MIAGLPLESWLLILLAVGAGLAVEIAFFHAHRRRGGARDEERMP